MKRVPSEVGKFGIGQIGKCFMAPVAAAEDGEPSLETIIATEKVSTYLSYHFLGFHIESEMLENGMHTSKFRRRLLF